MKPSLKTVQRIKQLSILASLPELYKKSNLSSYKKKGGGKRGRKYFDIDKSHTQVSRCNSTNLNGQRQI